MARDPFVRRSFAQGVPPVAAVCIGTAPWTSRPGRVLDPSEQDTAELMDQVWGSPFNVLDTSNVYGNGGDSERRIGAAIRHKGGIPEGFVVQTKLDRDPVTGSFSGERMWRSLEESFDRLGVDQIPMLYLHDPENTTWDDAFGPGGAVAALTAMKDQGLADAIGISGGPVPMLIDYVQTGLFSAVITHNRFTLVDRSAEPLLACAADVGVGVFNAAPYGGGLLASYPADNARYAYRPARPAVLHAAREMARLLAGHGISLAAAALQFGFRDERITSTIVSVATVAQLHELAALATAPIPEPLWAELETLVPPSAEWIHDDRTGARPTA